MSWVPLHESGIYYALVAADPETGSGTLVDSTVTVAGGGDTPRDWTLYFGSPSLPTGRVRITVVSHESPGGGGTRFYWTNGVDEDVQSNESGSPSLDFQPSPLVMDVVSNGENYYVRFDWNGTGTTLDAEFFIEVEMDEGGGCFWTDLVNTEQFCSDDPPP